MRAIIFDLWQTLGTKHIGISSTLRQHFNIEHTPDYLERYEKAVQLHKWESMEAMAKSYLDTFSIEVHEENIQFVVFTFQKGITQATLFDGMKELLQELSQKYKLALLSNTTSFEAEVVKRWGISDLFSAEVFSWQTGTLKPSQESFETVLIKLEVSPDQCLFIDDGMKNVKAAEAYGLKGIQFKSVAQVKEELSNP